MSGLVKRGGRTDFVCATCGKTIPAGTPHFRTGSAPYTRTCEAHGMPKDMPKATKTVKAAKTGGKKVSKGNGKTTIIKKGVAKPEAKPSTGAKNGKFAAKAKAKVEAPVENPAEDVVETPVIE